MKLKITNSDVKGYSRVLGIGYCKLQNLLYGTSPIGYNCGTFGWNYDFYEIQTPKGVVGIVTGYRYPDSIITKRPDYKLVEKYDLMAEKIRGDYLLPYEKQKERLHKLLLQFIDKCF